MKDEHKQQCLNIMGIQTWYSRYILPFAKPLSLDKTEIKPITHRTQTTDNKNIVHDLQQPFCIMVITISPDFLILADVPHTTNLNINEHQLLLSNIIFSLGWEDNTENKDFFSWPLTGIKKNWHPQDIVDTFLGFLQHRFQLEKRKKGLVMGSISSNYFVGTSQQSMPQGIHNVNGILTAFTYSLDQLLKIPKLKKDSWHHIYKLSTKVNFKP